VSQRTGLTQSQVAHIAFGASASLGLSTPAGGARVQGSAGKNYQSGIVSDEQKVLNTMTSEQLAAFKQFGDRVTRDASTVNALSSDSREGREMSSSLAAATSRAERAEAVYAQRRAMAERMSTAHERGESISIDIAQDPHNMAMFLRYAEQYGETSAAAHALMQAELARQAPGPTRTFSDGSAVPSTFTAIRDIHGQERASTELAPALQQVQQANNAKVNEQPDKPVPQRGRTEAPSSSTRKDLMQTRQKVHGVTRDATEAFDAKAGIVKTPDGTLKSAKSLFSQTGKQAAGDADLTLDAAKEAAKKLIQRDQ